MQLILLAKLKELLKANDYPEHFNNPLIQKCMHQIFTNNMKDNSGKKNVNYVHSLQYIKGASEGKPLKQTI